MGNYSKDNCRWADIHTQASNRRIDNTGVSWSELLQKYRTRINVDGKTHNLGNFENIEDALEARKEGELKYLGKIINEIQ